MAGGAVINTSGTAAGYAHLVDPNRKWYNNTRLIKLNAWIVLLLITSSTNGYDGSMMNGLQSLTVWKEEFNNPQGADLGLLNAIQNIGTLAGLPFAPYVSDGLGRRMAILIGAILMCVGAALQTASQNVNTFIGARFLLGFGLTFAANAAPMLVTEVSYPTYRGQLTSLYNSLWFAGSIIAAWATFGTFKIPSGWSWRIPSLIQATPSVLQVLLIFFAPESPRWLINKGREAQALKTLAYYHANGNEDDPLVRYEFEEIKAAIELDRSVASVGWKSFITDAGNRKRLRIIVALAWFSQWSGNGLISYYLTKVLDQIGITDATTQLLINGILQIWNFFWAVFAAFMVDKLGRRILFLTSISGMFVFYLLQTVCIATFVKDGNEGAGHSVIAFVFLFNAFYALAFTPLIVSYTVEILPYQLRECPFHDSVPKGAVALLLPRSHCLSAGSIRFTIFNFVISLALIFNQYVNPIALKAIGWKYYIVYVCWLAFEAVFLYFFLVETKGRSLEETAALFDGVQKTEAIAETAAAHMGPAGDHESDSDVHEKGDEHVLHHELEKE